MRALVVVLLSLLTLGVSPVAADDAAKLAANKKTVLEFYEAGLNRKDFDAAAKFFGSRYVQHACSSIDYVGS